MGSMTRTQLSPELISDSDGLRKAQSVLLEIIEISSDDEDDSDIRLTNTRHAQTALAGRPEVVELTDSDTYDTSSDFPDKLTEFVKSPSKAPLGTKKSISQTPKDFLALYVDDSDADDNSILILNEPRSTRKPIQRARISPVKEIFPVARYNQGSSNSESCGENRNQAGIPLRPQEIVGSLTPLTNKLHSRISLRGKAEEQARRETYAKKLFSELNSTIFNDGLPCETKLSWNKRLLTTAGRARWHRSRDGVQTTEIELAAKILDHDERIRNTLSHEMCHLACWIINGDLQESHGPAFKAWANKVMTKRPEIEITVGAAMNEK